MCWQPVGPDLACFGRSPGGYVNVCLWERELWQVEEQYGSRIDLYEMPCVELMEKTTLQNEP